jgi:hypothetical protein
LDQSQELHYIKASRKLSPSFIRQTSTQHGIYATCSEGFYTSRACLTLTRFLLTRTRDVRSAMSRTSVARRQAGVSTAPPEYIGYRLQGSTCNEPAESPRSYNADTPQMLSNHARMAERGLPRAPSAIATTNSAPLATANGSFARIISHQDGLLFLRAEQHKNVST